MKLIKNSSSIPSQKHSNVKKKSSEASSVKKLDSVNNKTIESEIEKHVNKLINRCICEEKFPIIQIGEGKYRIGSTKTIVFIRVCINLSLFLYNLLF